MTSIGDTLAYPHDPQIHTLFEQAVSRTPDAVAVTCDTCALTFRELNARANDLAQRLREQGVGPDVLVGLCIHRSLDMVVGLLGVLKAGGAYVPLDPDYPVARLHWMLADANPEILLTDVSTRKRIPATDVPVWCLDDPAGHTLQREENLPRTGSSASLAYVIYTSGSTGRPKGVMIEHRSLVNHMHWMQARFPLTADDRVLQKTTISADAAVWEFFAPLLAGARLVLAPPDVQRMPDELIATVQRERITVLQVVPSMLEAMLDAGGLDRCTSLRRLYCGGEALPRSVINRFCSISGASLINLYGPTEATIDATFAECTAAGDGQPVLIGRPIANTHLHVLDANMQQVAKGQSGELYIGGDGLARGYLGRADLTAQRFVTDPFDQRTHARLYRTGDRVRQHDDGQLEFIDRLDHQLKLRGFRIEPAEIETILALHPAVRQAVVVARDDSPVGARLVAYLVPARQPLPDTEVLRSWVGEHLPAHLHPAAYVVLDRLPLTANGKLDRNALPAPAAAALHTTATKTPPRTATQMLVANVWRDLLGGEQPDVDMDFFMAGGHSLLAAQMVSRLNERCASALTLRAVFAAPTIAGVARCIDRADQADKPAAANDADKACKDTTPGSLGIGRGNDEHASAFEQRLSFAQQRLWFLEQAYPGNAAYGIYLGWRVRGPLDLQALRTALGWLKARHEPLRATLVNENGRPHWVTTDASDDVLQIADAHTVSDALRALHAEPFNLEQDALFRARWHALGVDDGVFLIGVHHSVFDGWSADILERELALLYAAAAQGQPQPLSPLALRYADYVAWQHEQPGTSAYARQLDYWRATLRDLPTVALPLDRPHPASPTFAGASVEIDIPAATVSALTALARRTGTTRFMTLLAPFLVVLQRWTKQHELVVGTVADGRAQPALRELIGLFVNTLVLRADLSGGLSFSALLAQVRATVLGAYAHQSVPFEKLVEQLAPRRDAARNPLFQVMFAFQDLPSVPLALPGVEIEPLAPVTSTAKFDLTLQVVATPVGLRAHWEYNVDVFDVHTIESVAGAYRCALEAMVANPEQGIDAAPIVSAADRACQLDTWRTTTPVDYPRERNIGQLFEAQAAQHPDAAAVVNGAETLSYGALNVAANRLAHHLIATGVTPGDRIAILLTRSPSLIVTLLAILKAGAAYVPLDPAHPRARLAALLDDVEPRLLITHSTLASNLGDGGPARLLLDRMAAELAGHSTDNPGVALANHHLAYIAFTSGSTGTPKGVAVTHHNVVQLACGWASSIVTSDLTIAQLSNIAFDAATFEIWGALLNGARLAVVATEDLLAPTALAEQLRRHRVAVLFMTTALFDQICRDAPATLHGVTHIVFGGEQGRAEPVAMLRQSGFTGTLWNAYGPTETTTFATLFEVDAAAPTAGYLPIGKPLPGVRAYVLDDKDALLPAGFAGQLHIGGDGVAAGYWRRPQLTARQFVHDPFVDDVDARIYRTGDRVRWGPDGALEFLGRADRQCKIRGFRVEPGEIEVALRAQPSVRDARVLARTTATGDRALAAFVVPANAAAFDEAALRAALGKRLPAYLRPAVYQPIERVPLTANRKVDVQALLASLHDAPAPARAYAAPRTDTERTLCRLWQDALALPRIGIDDDFFEHGGHSLLAARLFARQDGELDRILPISVLFEAPTIRALALRYRDGATARSTVVPITTNDGQPGVFAVPGVNGNVVCYADLAAALGARLSFFGLQAVGLDGDATPLASIDEIAAHNVQVLRRQQPHGPYRLIGACFGALVAYEMARQLIASGAGVAFLGLLDPAKLPDVARRKPVAHDNPSALTATVDLLHNRLMLYRSTLRSLSMRERLAFLVQKTGRVLRGVGRRDSALFDRRELQQRRVYMANIAALNRYTGGPLGGTAPPLHVYGTQRMFQPASRETRFDWAAWSGIATHYHLVPGSDSGDMLTGHNAQHLARELATHLQESASFGTIQNTSQGASH